MPEQTRKTGLLVSLTRTPYRGFTAEDGREIPAGTKYDAYIVEAPDVAPIKVAITSDLSEALRPQIGKRVELLVAMSARGNTLRYRAVPAAPAAA